MTTVSAPTAARKAKRQPVRRLAYDARQQLLTLTIDGEEFYYWSERWLHVEAPLHAFRLTKLRRPGVEPDHYDAKFNAATNEKHCDCKGFTRWHHCKHADAVAAIVGRNLV